MYTIVCRIHSGREVNKCSYTTVRIQPWCCQQYSLLQSKFRPEDGPVQRPKHVVCLINDSPQYSCVLTLPTFLCLLVRNRDVTVEDEKHIFSAPLFIVICGLPGSTIFFSTLFNKQHDFQKRFSDNKTYFDFLCNYRLKYFLF